MARIRRAAETDSLELLLDTICNVFGGMILMAILVVVQTQSTAGRIPGPKPEELDRALEKRRLEAELKRVREGLGGLAEQKNSLQRLCASIDSPSMAKLNTTREGFAKAIKGADQRVEALRADLPRAKEELAKIAQSSDDTDRQLREKEAQIKALKKKARGATEAPRRKVRLPHRRGPAATAPRYYVVKGERTYPFYDPLRERDNPHCTVSSRSGFLRDVTIKPKAGKGYPVPKRGTDSAELLASLRGYRPRLYHVALFVYDDSVSFGSFLNLKETVLKSGYAYVVVPCLSHEGGIELQRGVHETE